MKYIKYIGSIIGLISFMLIWYFYDWKLAVLILAVIWGNNIERKFEND